MPDPIIDRDAELAATLAELDQAAAQESAWRDEKERLARKARALGGTLRLVADHTLMTHTGVAKLIARTDPDMDGPDNVG